MLWNEVLRIMKFGPSKRPAAETLYHKSTSQPSETNLNALNASNSVGGSGNYISRMVDGSNLETNPHHSSQHAMLDRIDRNNGDVSNQGIYGQTAPVIYASDSV